MGRSRPVGWRYDSVRHALAARGISTMRRFYAKRYELTAYPLGRGQTRFKFARAGARKFRLEPVQVEISTRSKPNSWGYPVSEEDVKEVLEMMTPGEYGLGPSEVLLTAYEPAPGGARLANDVFGQAFVNKRIRLYGMRTKGGKFLWSYTPTPMSVRDVEVSEDPESMRKFYMHDVLPHEIAHMRFGHTLPARKLKPLNRIDRENEANVFSEDWRVARDIPLPHVTAVMRIADRFSVPMRGGRPKDVQLSLFDRPGQWMVSRPFVENKVKFIPPEVPE